MTVSAVVIVYNGEEFVADAVRSILAQTRRPDEVIVVDDGSTDGTPAVLERFGDAIRVVRQVNGGEPVARNRGIRESRTDCVSFLDADDLWEPEYIEEVMRRYERCPALVMVFTGFRELRTQTGETWVYVDPLPADWVRSYLFSSLRVTTPSRTVINRRLAEELGPFDESLHGCVDQDLFMRLALAGPYEYIPRMLVTMRRFSGNLSARLAWNWQGQRAFYRKHAHTFGHGLRGTLIARRAMGICRFQYSRCYLRQGRRLAAGLAALDAMRLWPFISWRHWARLWAGILLGGCSTT